MILVVDDEIWYCIPLINVLQAAGFATRQVTTPEECLKIVSSKENISLIILDVMLPVGDLSMTETDLGRRTGLVLLKKIREMRADIPIVIMSNASISFSQVETPFTIFLRKRDASLDEILALVERLTKSK